MRYFRFTIREMQYKKLLDKQKVIVCLLAIFLFSVLFAFFGVYDSRQMAFPLRIGYWASTIFAGVVAGLISLPLVLRGKLKKAPIPLKILVLSALAALPVPVVIAAYSGGLVGEWPLINWPIQYLLALIVALVINMTMYTSFVTIGWIPNESATADSSLQQKSFENAFMQRLPAKYHEAQLYAVSSEDHYLQVHTSLGQELILMRLSDALKELRNADGLQTHRSWWVARGGVADTVKQKSKNYLILKSGVSAPISRTFLKSARAAKYIS